jgi:hypothetical protein
MDLLLQQMQYLSATAGFLEDAGLHIGSVEDTGGKVVIHLEPVTEEQMTNAIPTFQSIEVLAVANKKIGPDLEIRFVSKDDKEATKH